MGRRRRSPCGLDGAGGQDLDEVCASTRGAVEVAVHAEASTSGGEGRGEKSAVRARSASVQRKTPVSVVAGAVTPTRTPLANFATKTPVRAKRLAGG